jgi:hypothetical protein
MRQRQVELQLHRKTGKVAVFRSRFISFREDQDLIRNQGELDFLCFVVDFSAPVDLFPSLDSLIGQLLEGLVYYLYLELCVFGFDVGTQSFES